MNSVQAEAQRYIDHGWQVVRLLPKEKKCVDPDWLTRVYAALDFKEDDNLGVKHKNGVVDLDLDCPEATFMADVFVPKTKAVYGRESRRRSHRLFMCPGLESPIVFKDEITRKVLLELRVNHQTMAPPSVHPSGERVEWEDPNDIVAMLVELALLWRSIRLTATGAMMARYYNPPGARHDWTLALAGLLRRLGVTQHEAELLITRAAQWARDPDEKDRRDAVRSTYAREEDAPTTGGKTLAELMGQYGAECVATLHKIWDADNGVSKSLIEKMNETHAVIFDQGGNLIVITETTEDGRPQLRFSDTHTIAKLYPQMVHVGLSAKKKPVMKSLGQAWLDDPRRRFYCGIELAPGGHVNEGYYNLWKGFAVEPKPGAWPLFRQHLGLVANCNKDHEAYIFEWLAETAQHPERPIGIALAFKGIPGTGKSTFAKWFGHLFGPHFLHLDSEHRLLGNFNAHLHNSIVVLADEAVWAGGKQGLGALKRMITEDTLAIERKGFDVLIVKNMLHMIIASNEDWVVPKGFDDRRFAIFGTSDRRCKDAAFFSGVRRELFEQGGLSALLYDLLEHKRVLNLQDIPETPEGLEQNQFSASTNEAWWLEKLYCGSLVLPDDWPGEVLKDVLHADYINFLNHHHRGGRGPRATETQLGIFLTKRTPLRVSHGHPRRWIVPSLGTCREHWRKACRWPSDFDWGDSGLIREPGSDDIPF